MLSVLCRARVGRAEFWLLGLRPESPTQVWWRSLSAAITVVDTGADATGRQRSVQSPSRSGVPAFTPQSAQFHGPPPRGIQFRNDPRFRDGTVTGEIHPRFHFWNLVKAKT